MLTENVIATQLSVFGFAYLPRVAYDLVDGFVEGFERATALGLSARPDQRVTEFDVFDSVPALSSLASYPLVTDVCRAFFGRPSHVIASDVNLLVGDSYWHSDGFYETSFLRFVVYLEPLTGANGALRFIPGSHRSDNGWLGAPTRTVIEHSKRLALPGDRVPATVVASRPGDVIVFDTNVLHAAWNGTYRRQLAFNVVGEPATPAERSDTRRYFLNRYVSGSVRL